MATGPDSRLARSTLPAPLYEALEHIYAQGISDCMLVGGTALAGYYAGHRRSDDLDLFAATSPAVLATVLAVRSLRSKGCAIEELQHTNQFYSALCRLREHRFTVQVVLDVNLFAVGAALVADDGVRVAELQTLLMTKAATLLSRCSEKDLYDLAWLFGRFPEMNAAELIPLGAAIDGGMSAESLLISVTGARLDVAACDFSLTRSAAAVLAEISSLKASLQAAFENLARRAPAPTVGEMIRRLQNGKPRKRKRRE